MSCSGELSFPRQLGRITSGLTRCIAGRNSPSKSPHQEETLHLIRLIPAALVLLLGPGVFAQDWVDFVSREDHFSINFPSQPTVEAFMYTDEHGDPLPAHRYASTPGVGRYTVTVVDFRKVESVTIHRGAIAFAAHTIRKREGGEITFDAYAQIDRIEGHQLQITKADKSRYFAGIHYHDKRLFIIEAWVPPGAPPPAAFQVAMSILDDNGNVVRYNLNYDGSRTRVARGQQ